MSSGRVSNTISMASTPLERYPLPSVKREVFLRPPPRYSDRIARSKYYGIIFFDDDDDDELNLYSAETIEKYSKALYIKLKLMNKI